MSSGPPVDGGREVFDLNQSHAKDRRIIGDQDSNRPSAAERMVASQFNGSKHRRIQDGQHLLQHRQRRPFDELHTPERKSSDFTCSHMTTPVNPVRSVMDT